MVRPKGAIVLLFALGVFGIVGAASADPFVVDQANDTLPFSGGFDGNALTGQSFIPTLPLLSDVELLINDQSPGDGAGISMFVEIRDGTYTGALLGTSLPVAFPDFTPAPFITPLLAHFDFPSLVPLTPGQTYVMRVVNTSFPDDIGVFGTGFGVDAYANGEAFFLGQPVSISGPNVAPSDLWFREGLRAVPEPVSGLLFGTGALGWGIRRRLQSRRA